MWPSRKDGPTWELKHEHEIRDQLADAMRAAPAVPRLQLDMVGRVDERERAPPRPILSPAEVPPMRDRSSFETAGKFTEYHRERSAAIQRIRDSRRAPRPDRFRAKDEWFLKKLFKDEVDWEDRKRQEMGYPHVRRYFVCRDCDRERPCRMVPRCGCRCAGASCACIGSRPRRGPRPHGWGVPYVRYCEGGIHGAVHLSAHSRKHTLADVLKRPPQFIKGKGCVCSVCAIRFAR